MVNREFPFHHSPLTENKIIYEKYSLLLLTRLSGYDSL